MNIDYIFLCHLRQSSSYFCLVLRHALLLFCWVLAIILYFWYVKIIEFLAISLTTLPSFISCETTPDKDEIMQNDLKDFNQKIKVVYLENFIQKSAKYLSIWLESDGRCRHTKRIFFNIEVKYDYLNPTDFQKRD